MGSIENINQNDVLQKLIIIGVHYQSSGYLKNNRMSKFDKGAVGNVFFPKLITNLTRALRPWIYSLPEVQDSRR